MSYETGIFALLILAICSMIWGEWQRHLLLRHMFPNRKMRTKLVNCNQYLRILKIILLFFALIIQSTIVYLQYCLNQEVDIRILLGVFLILAIEQLIPTRHSHGT